MVHIIHTVTLYDILKAACERANEMLAEKDETIEAEIIITEATEIMAKLDAYKASLPSSYNIKMFGLGN